MNKIESLEKLREWDFNVADFIRYEPTLTEDELRERINISITPPGKLGIRTCRFGGSREFNLPFFFNLTHREAIDKAKSLFACGYQVIIDEYIPKEISLISGNVLLRQDHSGHYDVFFGDGVVRDIESKKNRENIESIEFVNGDRIKNEKIREAVEEAEDLILFLPKRAFIIEFSYGSKPAGIKLEPLVLWEIRAA